MTEKHELAKEFSDIYSIEPVIKRGVVLFLCYNLDKRYVLYDTFTKEVLRTEWINGHSGSEMKYTRPEIIPTKEYLETGFPTLIGLRDSLSLHIIDLREDGETY